MRKGGPMRDKRKRIGRKAKHKEEYNADDT